MGKNDAVSKKYLSRNDVFADAINYHFFGGQQVIRSERLKEQSPEELSLLFGKRGNESDGSRGRGREREKRPSALRTASFSVSGENTSAEQNPSEC